MTRQLVINALLGAYWKRKPEKGIIFHSDRGSQSASDDFQKLLKQLDFACSMSGKGNCYDNAAVESFFHTLKVELVYTMKFETRNQAISEIFNSIEGFYNRKRMHSTLGYCSPDEFEQQLEIEKVA
jgi:putative transposase